MDSVQEINNIRSVEAQSGLTISTESVSSGHSSSKAAQMTPNTPPSGPGSPTPEVLMQFWLDLFSDTDRCIFTGSGPADSALSLENSDVKVHQIGISEVNKFCSKYDVPPATLVRVAWAVTAQCFTGNDKPVFGNRDFSSAGLHSDPRIMTSRIDLSEEHSFIQVLASVRDSWVRALPYQRFTMEEIQSAGDFGSDPFFNSVLSFHKLKGGESNEADVTEFDIDVNVTEDTENITLKISVRPGLFSVDEANELSSCFILALSSIIRNPNLSTHQLNLVGGASLGQVWSWNSTIPRRIEKCIQDVVMEQRVVRPDTMAVSSWDGDLTYKQLDLLSTILAQDLLLVGISPGQIVPLCFEKTLWALVAMLAVLKAGAAFMHLDMSQGPDRRERILKKVSAKTALVSHKYSKEPVLPGCTRFVLEPHQLTRPLNSDNLPKISPSSTAYVIFTSGSTGEPKGVVIDHGAVVTSCAAHGNRVGFNEDSRVLQFSSFTFDASIMEFFTTLVFGGCVCIPSDDERLNDITAAINRQNVNLAFFIPSVARLINPSEIQTLRTIIIGGEVCLESDIERWSHLQAVIVAYGPTEATVFCITDDCKSPGRLPGNIGRAAGIVTWVVSPTNHNVLVPIGAVGELLLEGPTLARGYLDDLQKTSETFIENPHWLLHGSATTPGRQGMLYKTGDLVRYNGANGRLTYLRRKDNQVKLRGQRLELGEVEYQVKQAFPDAQQTIAEVIHPRSPEGVVQSNALLTVFFSMNSSTSPPSIIRDHPLARVCSLPVEAEKKLVEALPSYMVPSAFLLMDHIPLVETGKTNRHALRSIGASFSAQELTQANFSMDKMPNTDEEKSLHKIWANVLTIDPSTFGVDDSFLRLGGDSIAAMRASAMAKEAFLDVSVVDILRKKTLRAISGGLKATSGSSLPSNTAGDVSRPSLVQQLCLQQHPTEVPCFTESILLDLKFSIAFDRLSAALRSIASQYDIFQTRYKRTCSGDWGQFLSEKTNSIAIHHIQNEGKEQAEMIARLNGTVNIEKGPAFVAALFEEDGRQSLFLSIHQFLVDLASWEALIDKLEKIVSTFHSISTSPEGFSLSTTTDSVSQLLPDPHELESKAVILDYWGLEALDLPTFSSYKFTLDSNVSDALLGDCNIVYQTTLSDLMVATLLHSFYHQFLDRHGLQILLDGQQRQSRCGSVKSCKSLSRRSALLSSSLPQRGIDIQQTIRIIRDEIRKLSSKDSVLGRDNTKTIDHLAELSFRIIGASDSLLTPNSLFAPKPIPFRSLCGSMGEIPRLALLDVAVCVENSNVTTMLLYPTPLQPKMVEWMQLYKLTLENISHKMPQLRPRFTLSDFPGTFDTYEKLDEVQNWIEKRPGLPKLREIEDIYPCTPMQEFFLTLQSYSPDVWRNWIDIEISVSSGVLDITRLVKAWESVVKYHPLLRTTYLHGAPTEGRLLQMVLKNPKPPFIVVDGRQDRVPSLQETRDGKLGYVKHGVQHHVTFLILSDTHVRFRIALSHAIFDGFSLPILREDIKKAYEGHLFRDGPEYKPFVALNNEDTIRNSMEYWRGYLADAVPCMFPKSSRPFEEISSKCLTAPNIDFTQLQSFCSKNEITVANLIRIAWAIVLRYYTGLETSVFLEATSGRDAPIPGINQIFGPMLGILIFCIKLEDNKPMLEVLAETQEFYLHSLQYQWYRVHEVLGTHPPFNTAITLLQDRQQTTQNETVSVTHGDMIESQEYDITIVILDSGEASKIWFDFRPGFLEDNEAEEVTRRFSLALSHLTRSPESTPQQVLDSLRQL